MTEAVTGAPRVSINFADAAVNKDPFPALAEVRAMGPVVYNEASDVWMVAGFDTARMVLQDGGHFDQDTETMLRAVGGQHLTTLQPPMHTAVRGVFRHEFERGTLERWEPVIATIVAELAAPLIKRLADGEVVDLVPEAIHRIPARVISAMLGLNDAEIGDRFRRWIDGILGIMNASVESDPGRRSQLREQGDIAREEALAFCGEVLQMRRTIPGPPDLVRMLANSDVGKPPTSSEDPRFGADVTFLKERDLHAQIAQLAIAAQDNTANMMSAAAVYLARYPAVRSALAADRDLLPLAIDELLRHHGSIMVTPRLVRPGGVTLAGTHISAGSRVWALNGSANRDETRWPSADTFDIYREPKAHLAFGFGIHNCIGLNLARLELRVFVTLLLDAFPPYELVSDDIDYGTVFFTRGPQAVPIKLCGGATHDEDVKHAH